METIATERIWARCPNCNAKVVIYDNTAECKGVFLKCTRGCRTCEFELRIVNGKQVFPQETKRNDK